MFLANFSHAQSRQECCWSVAWILYHFMNRVLDNIAEINGADKNEIGMVVHEYPGLDFPYKYLERGVLNVMVDLMFVSS